MRIIKPRQFILKLDTYNTMAFFENDTKNINNIIKLDGNENPYGTVPDLFSNKDIFRGCNWYPDPLASNLVNQIAKRENLENDNVIITAGSDELIDLLIRVFVSENEQVLTFAPTFGMYKFLSNINNVKFKQLEMTLEVENNIARFTLDEELFLKEANNSKLIFINRPNNPDGMILDISFILKLLKKNSLIVVDEAYIEFSEFDSISPLVKNHLNLVVLKTFSKAYGLGGLRIGYGILPKYIKQFILKIKQPFNVNSIAQRTASVILENKLIFKQVNKIKNTREWFISQLLSLWKNYPYFHVFRSQGPFVLISLQDTSTAFNLYQFFKNKGILVRYYSNPLLDRCIRISIGTYTQMERVLGEFKSYMGEINNE